MGVFHDAAILKTLQDIRKLLQDQNRKLDRLIELLRRRSS